MRPPVRRTHKDRIVEVGLTEGEISPSDLTALRTRVLKAADVVESVAPDTTTKGKQIYIAIGELESHLGAAGTFIFEGEPTWNWGALRASAGQDFFLHKDVTIKDKDTFYKFRKFPSMEAGFRAFLAVKGIQAARPAAQSGNARAVALAMYQKGYFGGFHDPKTDPDADTKNVDDYAKRIVSVAKTVAKILGEPVSVTLGNAIPSEDQGLSTGTKVIVSLGLLGVTAGAIAYASKTA